MATNVRLTPDLERFARSCVEGGRYNNVSEVVRAALRLLQDRQARRSHLQRLVAEGYASAWDEGTGLVRGRAAGHGRGDRGGRGGGAHGWMSAARLTRASRRRNWPAPRGGSPATTR